MEIRAAHITLLITIKWMTLNKGYGKELCPSSCICSEYLLSCVNTSSVLQESPRGAIYLRIAGANIPELNINSFLHHESAVNLSLINNGIQSLNKGALSPLKNARFIDLGNNLIKEISGEMFDLEKLEELRLAYNRIIEIPGKAFIGENLSILDLSHNEIIKLDKKSFINCSSLSYLDLSSNGLTILFENTFSTLPFLRVLNLCHNKLSLQSGSPFVGLRNLAILDLSFNHLREVTPVLLKGLESLTELNLRNNTILEIRSGAFIDQHNVTILNLCGNAFTTMSGYQLAYLRKLKSLFICDMPYLEGIYFTYFYGLKLLENLQIYNNPILKNLHVSQMEPFISLQRLNLRNNHLGTVPESLIKLAKNLQELNFAHNPWNCDCKLHWFKLWVENHNQVKVLDGNLTRCNTQDDVSVDSENYWEFVESLDCKEVNIEHYQLQNPFKIGSTALLECHASGLPFPSISWVTPQKFVFHWRNPHTISKKELFMEHPRAHFQNMTEINSSKFDILSDGNLYIKGIQKEDVGIYICLASNRISNRTANLTLVIDHDDLMQVKIESTLFGIAISIAFLLIFLLAQLINSVLNRWGCCCQEQLSPKYRKIQKMLETIEQYRSQQLHKLRENYTWQVNRIKDNCYTQLEKLRENYAVQVKHFRGIKEYRAHQLSSIWEQYYDQARKIREYSTNQMNRVCENYIFQRDRIRKFRIQQLIKLRETYKLQQQTLNKVLCNLPNLNIEHCKIGVCDKSDSIVFPNAVMKPSGFPSYILSSNSLQSSDNSLSDEYFTPIQTPNLKRSHSTDQSEFGKTPLAHKDCNFLMEKV